MWIRRLIRSNGGSVNIIAESINEKLHVCLCSKDFVENLINRITSHFWIDVLKALCHLIDTVKTGNTNIQDSPIFYNPNIRINGKSIYLNKLYKTGINCMGNLFDCNGFFFERRTNKFKIQLVT